MAVDLRPRAYGAYELQDPVTGEYPGPDELGRKAFEYSGARKDFFEKFGTPALAELLNMDQFEGATPLAQSELDLQTGGPLALHVQMPVTPGNVQRVAALRQAVGEAWLQWALPQKINNTSTAPAPPSTRSTCTTARCGKTATRRCCPTTSSGLAPPTGRRWRRPKADPWTRPTSAVGRKETKRKCVCYV